MLDVGRRKDGSGVRRGKIGFGYRLAAAIVKPTLLACTKRQWRDADHVPAQGGLIIAANHISYVDPLTLALFLWERGRTAHFLAKAELFRVPVIGWVIRSAGQIPVYRRTTNAGTALRDAEAALRRGECVVIYPEGTTTTDPDLWPMTARTGLARLALTTGAPVIPVVQWGPHEIHRKGRKRVRLLPRTTVTVLTGPPVDLSHFAGAGLTAATLRGATETMMTAIRRQLEQLRGEASPAGVWDPATRTRTERHGHPDGNRHGHPDGNRHGHPDGNRHGRADDERRPA